MINSELVSRDHLIRKAVVYIRQSTEHQVAKNVESRALQHAMREKAGLLGWAEHQIEIVESDTATSARTTVGRSAYKNLLSEVALGEVGVVVSYESARLSRNCSDWYPLLDVCAVAGCLIADRDGVYDPSTANGRLLLGMKGILSEVELHTLHGRLRAGIENKARRGELKQSVPTGYVHQEDGRVVKDPDIGVQKGIEIVFDTFRQLRTANDVTRYLKRQGVRLPRRGPTGELKWKVPDRHMVTTILKNPAYAGAFVYGKKKKRERAVDETCPTQKRDDVEDSIVIVKDRYPAYISWETHERIQEIMRDNHADFVRKKSRGVPRDGTALLQGMTYCGECGKKMYVQYKDGTRYICNSRSRNKLNEPICQSVIAAPVEETIVRVFFQALVPAELDLYEEAVAERKSRISQVRAAKERELERLRYEVNLARRQYDRVDPDNRLVASELERRWEVALRELRDAENEIRSAQEARDKVILLHVPKKLRESFTEFGEKLPKIWDTDLLQQNQRKALLRCLIDKVVLHRNKEKREYISARLVWRGGASTEFNIRIPVNKYSTLSYFSEMEAKIIELHGEGTSDTDIAAALAQEGYLSPKGKRISTDAVKKLRLRNHRFQGICNQPSRHLKNTLTIAQVANLLGVGQSWLRYQIRKGIIQIDKNPITQTYPFPNDPETIQQLKELRDGQVKKVWVREGY